MDQLSSDAALPALRPELKILPGIREINGLKSWLIFDPVRHEYFQIDDNSCHILKEWDCGNVGALVERLSHRDVSVNEIEGLLRFLWANALTQAPPNGDLSFYSKTQRGKNRSWIARLLHAYLFFVIPLLRPDKILRKTEPLSRIFFTRGWWYFVAFVAIVGLYLTSRQWDQFVHTFVHFFSVEGLLYYAIALVFVKIAHECGHAYAATRYGCKIKSVGVAFIVMFPVLYTDTTDSWKLTSKKQRLTICGAGVAVELTTAAFATLIWAFAADGPLRTTTFFVATTSWVMSLLINMNPLMRFDAYHFLSDALGIQNLQSRTFAIGRWSLRENLFKLGEPVPEAMSVTLRRWLTLYAWMTWVYRFFLFAGIALIVHQMFFRPLGTFLAVFEIIFFILIPIFNELKEWSSRKMSIIKSPASWLTMSVVVGLFAALLLPWQSTIRIPAIVEPAKNVAIYAPADARIDDIFVQQALEVEKGQLLATLSSDDINTRVQVVRGEIALRQALLNRIAVDEQDLQQRIVLQSELIRFEEELAGLTQQMERLEIRAPFDGVVATMAGGIHAGRWVGEDQHILTVNSKGNAKVRGFVERSNLARLSGGTQARFIPELPELDTLTGTLELVEAANAKTLNIPALASHYGGAIAVNKSGDALSPLKSWYNISFNVSEFNDEITQERRGTVLAKGYPESIAVRLWRRVFHVMLREVFI